MHSKVETPDDSRLWPLLFTIIYDKVEASKLQRRLTEP